MSAKHKEDVLELHNINVLTSITAANNMNKGSSPVTVPGAPAAAAVDATNTTTETDSKINRDVNASHDDPSVDKETSTVDKPVGAVERKSTLGGGIELTNTNNLHVTVSSGNVEELGLDDGTAHKKVTWILMIVFTLHKKFVIVMYIDLMF